MRCVDDEPLYKYSDIKEIIKNLPTRKFENEPKRTALSKALKWTYGDEPSNSEIPNNCEKDCFLCKWLGEVDVCGRCRNRNLFAEADTEPKPKDEPTISKMEQVDKDINVRSKTEPQAENLFTDKDGDVWEWRGDAWYCISGDEPQTDEFEQFDREALILLIECQKERIAELLAKDEPQTCSVNGRPYDCGNCEYHKCTADEPQTEVIMPKKCKGCDSASKIIEAYSRGWTDGAEAVKKMPQTEYERASEQREHDILYEPTYDLDNGSM